MADETITNETQETLNPEEALAKLMRESVPKEKYDALQKQYNEFFSSVCDGSFSDANAQREPSEDDKEQEFYKAVMNIYKHDHFLGSPEFMEDAIIIDDYLTSHGQRSAFANSEGEITPEADVNNQNLTELFKACLEASDGDPTLCSAFFAKHIDTPYKTGTLGK